MNTFVHERNFWQSYKEAFGWPNLIILTAGSICLGIAIQWLWIERECGLDNLWQHSSIKCQDNRLRLLLGGPLVLSLNMFVLGLVTMIIRRHSVSRDAMRGILLCLSAPGILIIVVPIGKKWLPLLVTTVLSIEFLIYVRYLRHEANRAVQTLLGYLSAGIYLSFEESTLLVKITPNALEYDWRIARRRILYCLETKKLAAIIVLAEREIAPFAILLNWLEKQAMLRSLKLDIQIEAGEALH